MRQNASDGVPKEFWTTRFPDQIPDASILAKTVLADGFSVDGAKMVVVEAGHSDGDNTTVLHVPSIGLVVAGDVVYTNVHQLLRRRPRRLASRARHRRSIESDQGRFGSQRQDSRR